MTSRHLFQYYETDRNYRGRRQDVLQGQFVEVRQQLEEDAEVVEDPPVPVVIKGENRAIRISWYFSSTTNILMVDLYPFIPSFASFILRSIKLWILGTRIHSFVTIASE